MAVDAGGSCADLAPKAQETKAAEPVENSVGMDPLEANLLALFACLDADDDGEVSEATLADGLVRAGATGEEAQKLCANIAAGGVGSVSRTAWAAVAKRVVGKNGKAAKLNRTLFAKSINKNDGWRRFCAFVPSTSTRKRRRSLCDYMAHSWFLQDTRPPGN